jgi:excisionase family DNA binding protein
MTGIMRHYRPLEVAALLGVSKTTVYRWIDEGRLKAVKYTTKSKGIPADSLRDFMQGMRPDSGGKKE